MKRIVIVSGNRIFPATTGGQLHSLGIARALARLGHLVDIFSVAGRLEDYRAKGLFGATLRQTAIEARLVEYTHLNLLVGTVQSTVRRLEYPRVWQPALFARAWVPRRLKRLLSEADIIISDSSYCPPIPGPWSRKPSFLISHNLEYKLLQQGGPRERRFAGLLHRLESHAPRVYTDIFACAEEDQAFFREQDRSHRLAVPLIRCGVDPKEYAFTAQLRQRTRVQLGLEDADTVLVFSGSKFGPNVETYEEIKLFCRAEAEFLARHRVHFLVVGTVAAAPLREGALIATGRVPEILPFLACADAGLNMITRGSGSNVKLFEYLAAKLPVISTVFGVRGTHLQAPRDYLACSWSDLKAAIECFIAGGRTHWRAQAEAVWERHRQSCDIQYLVRDAIAVLPAFDHGESPAYDVALKSLA